jgi:putative ABC transport system ATP-binding protein
MSESMVQIRNVTKVYERGKQKVEVLHGLTLDIPKGDFVALMGPSGSGKTTLLNLIGGLDQPTAGEVSVGGSRIDNLKSGQLARWRAHNVGFVFQFYNLMPVLTAEGNVELPLLLTKLSSAQRKKNVAVALQVVGLSDRAKHKPKELSGGGTACRDCERWFLIRNRWSATAQRRSDRKTADEILGLLQVPNREHGKTIVISRTTLRRNLLSSYLASERNLRSRRESWESNRDSKSCDLAMNESRIWPSGLPTPYSPPHSRYPATTKTGFIIANLFRKKMRTTLTLPSVIMAFRCSACCVWSIKSSTPV